MAQSKIKKKILFILPNLNYGGAEKVTINFFNNLNEKKFDKELIIQGGKGPLGKKILKKKLIKYFQYNKFISFIPCLIRYIKKKEPHYIYSTLSHVSFFLLLLRIIGLVKAKLIIRESNFIKKTIFASKNKFLLFLYYKIFYKKIDIVIASSKTISNDIAKFTSLNKKKIFILYNPVEKIFFNKKKYKNKKNIIRFLSIGRLTYQKNFQNMIKILSVFKNYNWELKIIGTGKEKNNLIKLIIELGLNNKIKIIDNCHNIFKEIANTDYYLISSRWEGMPNAVIENIIMKKKNYFF